jgi:hypothetical protein
VKFRLMGILLSLVLIAVTLSGCGLLSQEPPSVASVTLSSQVDDRTKAAVNPVTSFPTKSKQLFASVRVEDPQPGTKVEARWLYDQDGDGSFKVVDVAEVSFTEKGNRYVAFSLRAPTTFPDGRYKVQVLLDGEQAQEVSFQIG